MRISHRHKFVFISVPKTGSTTVRKALNEHSDVRSDKDFSYPFHISAYALKKRFMENGWNWDDYFKFSFVRNPWAVQVSRWSYIHKSATRKLFESPNKLQESANEFTLKSRETLKRHKTFKEYVIANVSQSDRFIFDKDDGSLMMDFVGRQERLQGDFDIVCDRIGILRMELPFVNTTEHGHYAAYYDDESREAVAKSCAREVEVFGYEFGR
jgi:hypothetical protein